MSILTKEEKGRIYRHFVKDYLKEYMETYNDNPSSRFYGMSEGIKSWNV